MLLFTPGKIKRYLFSSHRVQLFFHMVVVLLHGPSLINARCPAGDCLWRPEDRTRSFKQNYLVFWQPALAFSFLLKSTEKRVFLILIWSTCSLKSCFEKNQCNLTIAHFAKASRTIPLPNAPGQRISDSFYSSMLRILYVRPAVGLPNLRIFDGSKSSIFDRRISNHRTIVGYSIIELVRSSNGSIDRISRYSIKGSKFDIRWFDGSNI